MTTQPDTYALIEALLAAVPDDAEHRDTIAAARTWLAQHRSKAGDVRGVALSARDALDVLLRALEGGRGLDVLRDARVAISRYVTPTPESGDESLSVHVVPTGGVALTRRGRHLTIYDEELEAVRDAINERKREVRKLQRRGLL